MTDARAAYTPQTMRFDLALAAYDLDSDDGLETAVIVSLFSDRRAHADDALPSGNDRRGWWGDTYPDVAGDKIGSRLWLFSRSKQTTQTLDTARDAARDALTWLVDDGVARSIDVQAYVVRSGVLGLDIAIARADKPVAQYRFESFWGGA